MYRVQRTIDSVVEKLIEQHRNLVSGLHNSEGFNTFMALPSDQMSHMCW